MFLLKTSSVNSRPKKSSGSLGVPGSSSGYTFSISIGKLNCTAVGSCKNKEQLNGLDSETMSVLARYSSLRFEKLASPTICPVVVIHSSLYRSQCANPSSVFRAAEWLGKSTMAHLSFCICTSTMRLPFLNIPRAVV